MSTQCSFLSLSGAVKAREADFVQILTDATSTWLNTASENAIREALFDNRISEVEMGTAKKAA